MNRLLMFIVLASIGLTTTGMASAQHDKNYGSPKSSYITDFKNVQHYKREYARAWNKNKHLNGNDDGELSPLTQEVIPEIHMSPLTIPIAIPTL